MLRTLTPVIQRVLCEDGEQRRFTIQATYNERHHRGFVKVGPNTVAGHARRRLNGRWRFEAKPDGRHAHLVKPPITHPLNTTVRVVDQDVPEYLRRNLAVVVASRLNGINPIYSVRFNTVGQTREVSHSGVKLAYSP